MDARLATMRPRIAGATLRAAMATAMTLAACHQQTRPSGAAPLAFGRQTVITEDDIAHMSARTAWDLVRMRAPRFSSDIDSTSGGSARVRIQEPHSVNSGESPLVVVDGMQVGDVSVLSSISASEVRLIRILDSDAAEPIYGLRAAGGAIVVETKRP